MQAGEGLADQRADQEHAEEEGGRSRGESALSAVCHADVEEEREPAQDENRVRDEHRPHDGQGDRIGLFLNGIHNDLDGKPSSSCGTEKRPTGHRESFWLSWCLPLPAVTGGRSTSMR